MDEENQLSGLVTSALDRVIGKKIEKSIVEAPKVHKAVVRRVENTGKVYAQFFDGAELTPIHEMNAAVLRVKLRHLDDDNRRRQEIAHLYYDILDNPLIRLPKLVDDPQNVYHIFPVFCERRDELQAYLQAQGIQTLIHYPIPPHQQECYREWSPLSLPVTEKIHREELSLPISQVLTPEEAATVANAVNGFRQ